MNILSQNKKMLLTDNYCIRVSEFVYGKYRWAITATSTHFDAPPMRIGEYDTEAQTVAAFNKLVKNIDKIEV